MLIHKVRVGDNDVTNKEEIAILMQDWYQVTANAEEPQTLTLTEFLEQNNIELPPISEDLFIEMEQPITPDEIRWALKEASENSASGPSGQSVAFYKLLFMEIPTLMTSAINQIAFLPGITDLEELKWIRTIKVIYISKKKQQSPHLIIDHCPCLKFYIKYRPVLLQPD